MDKEKSKKLDCSLCGHFVDCGNLSMARKLIQQQLATHKDELLSQEYELLVKTLDHLGYDFPNGEDACLLSEIPKLSRDLVEESIKILRKFEKPA